MPVVKKRHRLGFRSLDSNQVGGMSLAISLTIEAVIALGGLAWIYGAIYLAQHPEKPNSTPGGVAIAAAVGVLGIVIVVGMHRYLSSGVRIVEEEVIVRNALRTHRIPLAEVHGVERRGAPVLILRDGKTIALTGLQLWNSVASRGKYVDEGVEELQERLRSAQVTAESTRRQ